jgi:hypothetical protein
VRKTCANMSCLIFMSNDFLITYFQQLIFAQVLRTGRFFSQYYCKLTGQMATRKDDVTLKKCADFFQFQKPLNGSANFHPRAHPLPFLGD